MATSEAARPRAPRGTKILTQAFFAALNDIPDAQQEAVAKAALAAVKDQLQLRRQKAKLLNARARATAKPSVSGPKAIKPRAATSRSKSRRSTT